MSCPEAGRREVFEARLTAGRWPAKMLKVTAVDARTGEFVVFDSAGDHAQIRPIWRGEPTAETTAHEYRALPFRIVVHHSACSFAVQRSCRPHTKMRSAIGQRLWTGQIADSARLLSVRLARVGARRPGRSLPPSAWLGLLGAPRGMGSSGAGSALQTSYQQDFSPAGRGQGPWCEPDRGSTLKLTGGGLYRLTGGGLYRQMEVITMAVLAMLIGAGAIAHVFLGIFFVMGVGWLIASSL